MKSRELYSKEEAVKLLVKILSDESNAGADVSGDLNNEEVTSSFVAFSPFDKLKSEGRLPQVIIFGSVGHEIKVLSVGEDKANIKKFINDCLTGYSDSLDVNFDNYE